MTVTEKSYCHRPADGALDWTRPEIATTSPRPSARASLPGLLVRALELRKERAAGPLTLMSCDNIPGNGAILGQRRRRPRRAARPRPRALDRRATPPSPRSMVDRIAPATTAADLATVEDRWGYRDEAVVVCEPFRQWVIEDRFAARRPAWDQRRRQLRRRRHPVRAAQDARAQRRPVDARPPRHPRRPRAHLRQRRRPAARGLRPPHADRGEPSDPAAVPGIDPRAYVEQSLARLHNTAIRHRNQQIATDGSQKIVQRLLNPARERLARGQAAPLLAVASPAGWPTSSAPPTASAAPGPPTTRRPPPCRRHRRPRSATTRPALAAASSRSTRSSPPTSPPTTGFRRDVTAALAGLLAPRPMEVAARARSPARPPTLGTAT